MGRYEVILFKPFLYFVLFKGQKVNGHLFVNGQFILPLKIKAEDTRTAAAIRKITIGFFIILNWFNNKITTAVIIKLVVSIPILLLECYNPITLFDNIIHVFHCRNRAHIRFFLLS